MSKRGLVSELHRPARKRFPHRHTLLRNVHDLYQADLVEMIPYANENNGYKYILTCINCFSKYAYCAPLKNKTSKEVADQMENFILSKLNRRMIPNHLQTDAGKEFFGQPFRNLMQKFNINHYSTFSPMKAAIVERFNRTLKTKMWLELNLQGSYRWLDVLPSLVSTYNATKHRSIGMAPRDVNLKNQDLIALRLNRPKQILGKTSKFKLGDLVRISKVKHIFQKGYESNWSYEVFRVVKVGNTFPRVYHLEDLLGKPISGGFYEQELLKTSHPDVYLIEKVLQRKGNKVLVKYLGFDHRDNQWIPASSLLGK